MPFALILFIAMPIIEIAVLLRVGDSLGWLLTLGIVVFTAFLGAAMLRQQGLATLNKARQRMSSGEMPAEQLLEGILLMVGGVLLLTPGFVTDAFGFACLVPWTRQWLVGRIAARSVMGFGGIGGMADRRTSESMRSTDSVGTPVGSGATHGAEQSAESGSVFNSTPGGRPKPDSTDSKASGNVIDAEFRQIDE
ncbi:MAG: UPF0716 protein FxsA [Granulosicoccus sp.]|jgi:UPF0716 protein FxsA